MELEDPAMVPLKGRGGGARSSRRQAEKEKKMKKKTESGFSIVSCRSTKLIRPRDRRTHPVARTRVVGRDELVVGGV